MNLLDLILAIVLPIAAGSGLLLLVGISPRMDRLGWSGWALMAGFLATAAILWGAIAFELPLEPGWMRVTLGVVALIGAAGGLLRKSEAPPPPHRGMSGQSRIAMGLCIVLAMAAVTDGVVTKMIAPAILDDESTNWASKAKELYVAKGFNDGLAEQIALGEKMLWARAWHPNYPNLVPLLHLWSYVNAGRIVHFEGRIPVLLFRYGLILVLAGAVLHRYRGPLAGLLLVPAAFFVSLVDQGADVVVAFAFLATTDGLARFLETHDRRWWRLTALGAMFMVGAKHDGAIYAAAIGAAGILHLVLSRTGRPRLGKDLLWLLAPASAILSTLWFNHRFDTYTKVLAAQPDGMTLIERLWTHLGQRSTHVAAVTWDGLTGLGAGSRLLHLLFLLLMVTSPLLAFGKRMRFLTLTLLLSWAGVALIMIGTPYQFEWFVRCSLVRVMDQWAPLIGVWIAALLEAIRIRNAAHPLTAPTTGRPSGAIARRALRIARMAIVTLGIVGTAAGPFLVLRQADAVKTLPRRVALLGEPESARLRAFLKQSFGVYDVIRNQSPESRAVVIVVPHYQSRAMEAYFSLTGLLFPKLIAPLFLGIGDLSSFLTTFQFTYTNSLDGIMELTGAEVDVVLESGGEIPSGLEFHAIATAEPFVFGRGRILPGRSASRPGQTDGADSRAATTRSR